MGAAIALKCNGALDTLPGSPLTPEDDLALSRFETGIPGVDEILHGGLMKAGVYLVRGEPGCGKTIFANQICFHGGQGPRKAAYVTLLAEAHGRMFEHMERFSFFRPDSVPSDVYYVSAFNALRERGLPGVTMLLGDEIRARRVDVLVLDGLVTASQASGSPEELKMFVSELQVHATLMDCTVLLLNSVSANEPVTSEQTMVDGIFRLRHELVGSRHERSLEVAKFRGSPTLEGIHAMRIGDDGITVFPRLEASRTSPVTHHRDAPFLSTGVLGLDGLIDAGGYRRASVTAVVGSPGTGKTLLGLHFVGKATPEEHALLFGFYESPDLLLEIAKRFGHDLDALREQGVFEIMWQAYGALRLDELAYRLLDAVERTGCKRLFIDGLGGFLSSRQYAERGATFLAALANELRRLGVTTLISAESEDPQGFVVPERSYGLSAIADNLIRLCLDERGGHTRRLVSIGKVRGSRIDLSMREVVLSDSGLQVEQTDVLAQKAQG